VEKLALTQHQMLTKFYRLTVQTRDGKLNNTLSGEQVAPFPSSLGRERGLAVDNERGWRTPWTVRDIYNHPRTTRPRCKLDGIFQFPY
jgi:hypothetical protein